MCNILTYLANESFMFIFIISEASTYEDEENFLPIVVMLHVTVSCAVFTVSSSRCPHISLFAHSLPSLLPKEKKREMGNIQHFD